MSEAVWQALVPFLKDVRSVDFTGGGEPLLQKNLVNRIIEAKQHGCDAGFLTNGLLLDASVTDQLIDTGLNWICFSIDGADKTTYEQIRQGSDFDKVCGNIACLTQRAASLRPLVMINFVIMNKNCHQLEDLIELAGDLGVDQVNFKQCDVIRGEHGSGYGLFARTRTETVKQMQHALDKAVRRARKRHVTVRSFSFTPEEQPVCDQDPRDSLFIRHDGGVFPCINLAYAGPSTFLGEEIRFPRVMYGRVPEMPLDALWETDNCRFFRRTFEQRVRIHDQVLGRYDYGHSIVKLNEAFAAAVQSMPQAPEGCRRCHYLYGI